MNRIIAASEATVKDADSRFRSSVQMALHDYTYGFTGDPLLQFACVYSGKGSEGICIIESGPSIVLLTPHLCFIFLS